MKKALILILSLALSLNLFAQNKAKTEADTTKVKLIKKNVVTVIEEGNKVKIKVGEDNGVEVVTDDWGDTTHIRIGRRTFKVIDGRHGTHVKIEKEKNLKKWRGRFNPYWSGLEVGINVISGADYSLYEGKYDNFGDFMNLNPGKSLSWNLNILEWAFTNERRNFGVITGLGFSFTDYTFSEPITLTKEDGSGKIIPASLPLQDRDNNRFKKSKLHVNYITAPLILQIKTPLRMGNSNLYLAGGVIGSLYLGSYTKYKYRRGSKSKSRNGFNINQWKYELTGRIGFGDFCVFANYSMTPLFKTGKGPDVQPLMIGISFPNI